MAVVSDGSVWAWGYGWNGQLGRNSTDDSWVPVRVWGTGPAGTTFSAVSAGFIHSVGVASDGSLWSWGHFDDGRLGIDRKDDVLVPLRVRKAVSGGDALRQVSAGGSHTLMSTSDGSAWAWGRGANGRLGDNGTTSTSVPTRVRPLSPTLLGANCAPPATLIGQRCTLPGTTTYSVSYRYLGWSSPLATATITR
jgi:alpha-tubulin suppressor-like RCC1 family protein